MFFILTFQNLSKRIQTSGVAGEGPTEGMLARGGRLLCLVDRALGARAVLLAAWCGPWGI